MTQQNAGALAPVPPHIQVQALRSALGPTPAAIEERRPLTSYICQLWHTTPTLGVYHQLVGAMMTHPADSFHFYIASELSFLVGLYRMRLHLEGIHGYYAKD